MNQELIDYIKQQLEDSVPKKKIDNILLQQGWRQAEIDEAFSAAQGAVQASGPSRSDSFSGNFPKGGALGSGGSRKIVTFAAAAIIIVAVLAGVIIMALLGANDNGKKSGNEPASAPATSEPKNNTNNTTSPNPETNTQNTTSPAAEKINSEATAMIKKMETAITPPAGWAPQELIIGATPIAVFFKPTKEKNSSGKEFFYENVSIARSYFRSKNVSDAAQYLDYAKNLIKSSNQNYQINSEKKVKLSDGTEATLLTGSYTEEGNPMKNMQLYAFKGDYVYIVTGFVTAANWDKEKDMIGAAIMSFKFPQGL
jgi:hypothetical protein